MDIKLTKINSTLIDDVVLLHKENFSDEHNLFYFSNDLLKSYFSMFISREDVYFYGLTSNNVLVAVLLGGDPYQLEKIKNEFIQQYKFNLIKESIFNSLKYPKFFYKNFYEKIILRFNNYIKIKENINLKNNNFNILSIVVSSKYRKKGLGKILINNFEEIAKTKRKNFITLSVRKNNTKALKFYIKLGFKTFIETKTTLSLYKEIAYED